MKIRGIATLTKYIQEEDGSLRETWSHTEENLINARVVKDELLFGGDVFTDQLKIATSLQSTAPDFEQITLGQINAVGDPTLIPDDRTLSFRDGINPTTLIIKNRFLPPASTRTINSLGIVSGATLVDDPGATTTRNSYTYLLLGVPATQQDVEVLDISYKLFIDWTGTRLGAKEQSQVAVEWAIFDFPGHQNDRFRLRRPYPIYGYPSLMAVSETSKAFLGSIIDQSLTLNNNYQAISDLFNVTNDDFPFTPTTDSLVGRDDERCRVALKWGRTTGNDYLTEHCTGRLVRGVRAGGSGIGSGYSIANFLADGITGTAYTPQVFDNGEGMNDWMAEFLFDKTSNLSNVWSHDETTNVPMYDVNSVANSSWKPIITEGTIDPTFPKEYLLKVVTAGGLGVGEYKLYTTSFNSFADNERGWSSWLQPLWNYSATPFIDDWTDTTIIFNPRWCYDWLDTEDVVEFVTWEGYKGIAIIQIDAVSGVTETDRFTLSTYTQFGSRINDIDVDPGADKIYAATEGGLYEITVTGPTVTQLSPDACASVAVGDSGQVFAIFRDGAGSGRLSSSIGANWGTPLDLTGATINWDNVWRIFIDPDSTDYDLMIYEGPGPKNTVTQITENFPNAVDPFKIHWWNNPSKFIQTDGYQIVAFNTSPNADFYIHEYDVLGSTYAVQVTNGVWIYPGDIGECSNNVFAGGSSSGWDATCGGSGLLRDIKADLAVNNFGCQLKQVISYTDRGWNTENSNGVTDLTANDRRVGDNTYNFGFHATAPFHTESLRGCISKLVVGKPSPVATTYDLLFFLDDLKWANRASVTPILGSGFRALGFQFKLSVDEGGTSTLKDYANDDNEYSLFNQASNFQVELDADSAPLGGFFHVFSNKRILALWDSLRAMYYNDGDTGTTEPYNYYKTLVSGRMGGMAWYSPTGVIQNDFNDLFLQAYEWNGANWILDEDNTGPGKPLHTSTDALIDGLNIRWEDLLPSNSQDLIVDQYYNFVKNNDPNAILVETTTQDSSGDIDVYFRDITTASDSGTIPGSAPYRVYVPEAPLGSAPDNLWLTLPIDTVSKEFTATINGSPVDIFIDTNTTPAAGTIHITDPAAGEIYFNSADAGQSYTFNYLWINKFDDTEVL